MKSVRVRVPASTANLGPGFDSLGLALTLFNDVSVCCEGLRRSPAPRTQPTVQVTVEGCGTDELPLDHDNLIWRAARQVLAECRMSVRRVAIHSVNRIPPRAGLGSSAAACVAGILAANALSGSRLSPERLFQIAVRMEGHPDNVAPALWGGFTACYDAGGEPRAVRVPFRARVGVVVCVPETRLSTAKARSALPKRISHRDAVLAVGRAAALTAMLASGETCGLAAAVQDTLHQPYRARLIPGMQTALRTAPEHGALAAALSGAGPSIVAFVPRGDHDVAERVGRALERVFRRHGVAATARALRIDRRGARIATPGDCTAKSGTLGEEGR